MRFPGNTHFAFSVFDDTDGSTVDTVGPVYRLLAQLHVRTTKSVWCLPSVAKGSGGESLQSPTYCDFVRHLRDEGFEIGLHNVRNYDASRQIVHRGLQEFERLLLMSPRTHTNHAFNRDNLYWGRSRLNLGPLRMCYGLSRYGRVVTSEGHIPQSDCFWGDLCKDRIEYVRDFTFNEINLDTVNPWMPFHDPLKPFVQFWFSSSDGGDMNTFCSLLSEANQDRLEAEGGVCIVYTHFACGFAEHGTVHPRFDTLMRRLANKKGWFVPVADLLDFLRQRRTALRVSPRDISRLQTRWMREKFTGIGRTLAVRALHLT